MASKKKDNLWDDIIESARADRHVLLKLSPGAEQVPVEPKRAVGRPRTIHGARFGHYAGFDPEGSARPKCQTPGCKAYLKKDQISTCSDACRTKLVAHIERLKKYVE